MDAEPIALSPTLVVEDDPATRLRLQGLMAGVADDGARVAAVGDLATARERLREGDFALALVDVQLPDGNGIGLIDWMQVHAPRTQAVIVSAYAGEDTILAALRAGAAGYLLKDRDDIELVVSLKSLRRGGAPIDPSIARRILALLPPGPTRGGVATAVAGSDGPGSGAPPVPLSERESEILALVAQGFSNREIAEMLSLSRFTVEVHARNIYRKLAVGSRTEAVFEARAMGLLR
ncbi:response regulator transcription factor [Lysobacter sp. SG-8]|uniref:Response regulator transcription factor n=1 Tax=Marilutibacter penaei TaxID=2759900 RepID=A0A7W3U149_9GAMM|nr:response regulator transcription factor [Lysobacter penaei]MBB1087036.1 response regulator transcription factor [Lysobacter penaei]